LRLEQNFLTKKLGFAMPVMARARVEAGERGASALSVTVLGANAAAKVFYEREGFEPFARSMLRPLKG
jgi:GNAT superfamily N-acetyltransferase